MQPTAEDFRDIFLVPEAFFCFVTTFLPYKYQKKILNDKRDLIAVVAGRQVGKSEVISVVALREAILKPRSQILVLSATLRQARVIYDKIDAALQRNAALAGLIFTKSAERIQFINGSKILCLPTGEGDTIRGFSPTLIIFDEAAYVKDKVFQAVDPMRIKTKARMILITTPAGKIGWFYEAYMSNRYSTYHWPCTICPDISKKELKKLQEDKTEFEYRQEYLGEFIEEQDAYFPPSLLESAIGATEQKGPDKDWSYALGVDLARFGTDESVYTVVGFDGYKYYQVRVEYTSRKPLTDAIGRIRELDAKWNFSEIYIDETGLGGGVADVLQEETWSDKLRPITFSLQSKSEMYKNLRRLFEQELLKILPHKKCLLQLQQLQYKYASNRALMIHHPDKGHDDFPDSLALACMAALTPEASPDVFVR